MIKRVMKKRNVKNVLTMADYRTQNSGNFIASIVELGKHIQEDGGKMVYIAPLAYPGGYPWDEWLRNNGIEVVYFDEKRDESAVVNELTEIVEKYQIDLIHSHFGYLYRILIRNRKKLKVKIIFHDHMDYSWGSSIFKQKARQFIFSAVYRLCGVGVISVMEKKNRGYWLCGKKHWYVPNGLSLSRYVQYSMSREECRKLLGVRPDEKLCLFLGWDVMRKGLDVAIKAVELCNKETNLVLGIIGFGSEPSPEQLDKLRSLTATDPEQPCIRFLKSTEDIFAYHRASDVYLSASRFEAFSYGVLEAISQNVPVVVSNIDGTKWAWEYSKCTVFENEDIESCAEAIQKALSTRWDDSNGSEIIDNMK